MNFPLVSIIIVTYNSSDIIKRCLDSVLKITYPNKEIIIVDNNYSDNFNKILGEYKGKIKILFEKQNLGYSGGNNLGILNSKGEYICLLNPDTIVANDFLQPLVDKMKEDNSIAACQPLVYLLNDKEVINLTGKVTHFLGFDWIRDYLKKDVPLGGEITSFSGCGVLLRRSILKKTKVFDPLYFMYYEDSDLSWRFRLFGYSIFFVPKSVIFHDYKYIPVASYQSLKQKLFYNERNRLITIFKNYKLRTLIIIAPMLLLMEITMIVYAFINGWLPQKINTYISIIKSFSTIRESRKYVQKGRIVKDRNILDQFTDQINFKHFDHSILRVIINPIMHYYWVLAKNLI